ncbi:MAG: DUF4035 domain-containing protein [bacterium]
MLSRMPSYELTEWMAYDKIDPFGQERADLRNGVLCALIANRFEMLGKKGRRRRYKPADFMPKFGKERDSSETMLQKVKQLNAMLRGEDKTGK